MMRSALGAVFAILGFAGCTHGNVAREMPGAEELTAEPPNPSTMRLTEDTTVLPGELAGTVNSSAGAPIGNANLLITSLADGKHYRTRTTDDGAFRIAGLALGATSLSVSIIGYRAVVDTITLHPGIAVHLTMEANPTCFCDPPMHPPALTAWVRDARTQRAPKALVTLHLEDGSYVDSVTIVLPDASDDSALQMEITSCRPGTYDVRVSAPGYKSWQAHRVKAGAADCAKIVEKRILVSLQPLRDTTRQVVH